MREDGGEQVERRRDRVGRRGRASAFACALRIEGVEGHLRPMRSHSGGNQGPCPLAARTGVELPWACGRGRRAQRERQRPNGARARGFPAVSERGIPEAQHRIARPKPRGCCLACRTAGQKGGGTPRSRSPRPVSFSLRWRSALRPPLQLTGTSSHSPALRPRGRRARRPPVEPQAPPGLAAPPMRRGAYIPLALDADPGPCSLASAGLELLLRRPDSASIASAESVRATRACRGARVEKECGR